MSEPAQAVAKEAVRVAASLHQLPELPYALDALEPHVDARTLEIHHGKHHASYVDNLNAALEGHPELQERTATWLVLNANKLPDDIRTSVRNNAGGHLNHSLLWKAMAPGARTRPEGPLAEAIERDFGSLGGLRKQLEAVALKAFGSAWVWLARARQDAGRLEVLVSSGHGNPLTQGYYPVLVADLWEHAYYLKHQNRRADYLKDWWNVVDWREAERLFEGSRAPSESLHFPFP